MIVEVCANTIEIAMAAAEAGADRLEICQNLDVGGLTPSYGFIEKACQIGIPVRVLIRPRAGNFSYSINQIECMLKDIQMCEEMGAEGVLVGALDQEQNLDHRSNQIFLDSSDKLSFIFHRGIDLLGAEGLVQIHEMGFDGALCSGDLSGVGEGKEKLRAYNQLNLSQFEIVAGGGVNSENIESLKEIACTAVHFSCHQKIGVGSQYDFQYAFDLEKWHRIAGAAK